MLKTLALSLKLALRLLWPGGLRPASSRPMRAAMVSVALSLLPLVLVLEVSDGMVSGILSRYMETASGHLRVYFPERLSETALERQQQRMQESPRLRYVTRELEGQALLFVRGTQLPVQLRGWEVNRLSQDVGLQRYLQLRAGSFDLGPGQVVVGTAIAEQLGLQIGDSLTLLTAAVLSSGRFFPKTKLLRVSGITSIGYQEIDKLWVFTSYQLAEELLHLNSSRQSLVLKVADPLAIDDQFKSSLRRELNIPLSAVQLSWKDLSQSLRQNFEVTQTILLLTMALMVLLAVSNISSSLIIMVLENHRQIGVMRACGGSSALVLLIYLWVGLVSAAAALIPGLVLGLLLSWQVNRIVLLANLLVNGSARLLGLLAPEDKLDLLNASYYLEHIPIHIKLFPLLLVALGTLSLSLLASLLPAWRASRLETLQLVRGGH